MDKEDKQVLAHIQKQRGEKARLDKLKQQVDILKAKGRSAAKNFGDRRIAAERTGASSFWMPSRHRGPHGYGLADLGGPQGDVLSSTVRPARLTRWPITSRN